MKSLTTALVLGCLGLICLISYVLGIPYVESESGNTAMLLLGAGGMLLMMAASWTAIPSPARIGDRHDS